MKIKRCHRLIHLQRHVYLFQQYLRCLWIDLDVLYGFAPKNLKRKSFLMVPWHIPIFLKGGGVDLVFILMFLTDGQTDIYSQCRLSTNSIGIPRRIKRNVQIAPRFKMKRFQVILYKSAIAFSVFYF